MSKKAEVETKATPKLIGLFERVTQLRRERGITEEEMKAEPMAERVELLWREVLIEFGMVNTLN